MDQYSNTSIKPIKNGTNQLLKYNNLTTFSKNEQNSEKFIIMDQRSKDD